MILYHGSRHRFEWPDYAEIVEKTLDRTTHPRGLWLTSMPTIAALYGPYVYAVEVDAEPTMVDDIDAALRPRHRHFQYGEEMLITPGRIVQTALLIDLDRIVDFELVDQEIAAVVAA